MMEIHIVKNDIFSIFIESWLWLAGFEYWTWDAVLNIYTAVTDGEIVISSLETPHSYKLVYKKHNFNAFGEKVQPSFIIMSM